MASPFDETEFIDRDLPASRSGSPVSPSLPGTPPVAGRPPTREELEAKVTETQGRIAELRRAQEELERERAQIDEARRRRAEFETGRTEMVHHLTRGVGLIEEAELRARREAEQMARTLVGFKEALARVQAIREDAWSQENWSQELTRALTAIENARMEWNSARLKWPVLDGLTDAPTGPASTTSGPGNDWLLQRSSGELWRVGLALTWPLAVVSLLALLAVVLLFRH